MSFLDGILGDGSLTNIIEGVWSEPASTLAKGLGLAENRRIVDASDRFELRGSGNCWLVLSGTLDILGIRRRQGLYRAGRRRWSGVFHDC